MTSSLLGSICKAVWSDSFASLSILIAVMVVMAVFISVMVMMLHVQTAHTRTKGLAKFTRRDVRPWRLGALAFHMMVMTLLRQANFCLKA